MGCLQLSEAILELEDPLDASRIHALILQLLNPMEAVDVLHREEPDPAFGARGPDQAESLVVAERLGVHVDETGNDADYEATFVGMHVRYATSFRTGRSRAAPSATPSTSSTCSTGITVSFLSTCGATSRKSFRFLAGRTNVVTPAR